MNKKVGNLVPRKTVYSDNILRKKHGNIHFYRLQSYSCLDYRSGWISRTDGSNSKNKKREDNARIARNTCFSHSKGYAFQMRERDTVVSQQGFRVVCQNPWLTLPTHLPTYLPTYLPIYLPFPFPLCFPCSFEFVTTVDVAATRDPVKSFDFVAKTTYHVSRNF